MRSLRRPAFIVSFVIAAASGALLCRLPLLDTLGYEYALAAALIVSLLSGISASVMPGGLRRYFFIEGPDLFDLYFRTATGGVLIAVAMLIPSLVNGLFFVPFCNLFQGLVFFIMMPVFAALTASALGLFAGLLTKTRAGAAVLFVGIYFAFIGAGFYTFYSTPAVFVFHPFVGYYPGVLYDRIIRPDVRLLTYRFVTVVEISGLLSALAAVYDPQNLVLSLRRFYPGSAAARGAIFFLALAAGLHLFAAKLGHRATRADLEAHLQKRVTLPDMDLFFPDDADMRAVAEVTRDAAFQLHQVVSYLGVKPRHRIAVFFFRDADDKGRVMGAADTNVTKPWRREVYVIMEGPPHPVLRHELVHAVAADIAPGPFAVPGKWHGLVPNPGLIEGLASAAGGIRGDLTIHQWARAMETIGLLPTLGKLVGFGFFDLPAASAYTAAGSFCDFVKQRYGASTLMKAYQTGDFEKACGKSQRTLEEEWKAFLAEVPLIAADKAAARARFDKKPIIRTRCVHAVAALCDEARKEIHLGEFSSGMRLLESAHIKSGLSSDTSEQLFLAANEEGDWRRVRARIKEAVQDPNTGEADKNALEEMLVDLDVAEQRDRSYAAAYERLLSGAESEDRRRLLYVKAHLARTGTEYPRIFDVLSLRPGARAVSEILSALLIAAEAASKPDDPVRTYLLARQFFNAEDYNQALRVLDRAETLGLLSTPSPLVVAARFMKADALTALGRYETATLLYGELAADASVREGLRETARDKAARAMFYQSYGKK